MSDTRITVALITHNSAQFLGACLDAIPGAFGSAPYDLVVADNDSTDATEKVVATHAPDATFVAMGRNAGYAAAINTVVARSTGPVFVLNPDTVLERGAIAPLVTALQRAGVGIAVPKVLDPDGTIDRSLRRTPTLARAFGEAVVGGKRAGRSARFGEVVIPDDAYATPHTADWALGAVMLISRECLTAVGEWDESFFLYSEETDFCLRAHDAGFSTWFEPAATVVHVGGESGTSPRLWTILTINRVRAYRKRHGRVATTAYWVTVTLGEALRAGRARATHREALGALWRGPHLLDRELARRCPPGAGTRPQLPTAGQSNSGVNTLT